jgi:prephenate dehydratase
MRPIVAFQGETGAFSEAAAEQLVPGEITLFPCPTFDATVRAVVNGHADYAAIPVKNLIAGPVHDALSAIAQFSSLEHVGEMKLPIHLSLLGLPGARVEALTEVLSHGIALQQCNLYLAAHPNMRTVEAHDTAGAARMVGIRRDPTVAAIAASWAAKYYGLVVLAERLEDRPDNVTTFTLIRRRNMFEEGAGTA